MIIRNYRIVSALHARSALSAVIGTLPDAPIPVRQRPANAELPQPILTVPPTI